MPETLLNVSLVACSFSPERIAALAARLCYSGMDLAALRETTFARSQGAFIEQIVDTGHHSVLEHASFTFVVEGASRVLLAQLTRHRIASYSVQSQRYVSLKDSFSYIIPPKIKALGPEAVSEYERQMHQAYSWYRQWQRLLEKGEGATRTRGLCSPAPARRALS